MKCNLIHYKLVYHYLKSLFLKFRIGEPNYIWLAKRKDTGQYAVVGGFVEVGESTEDALVRELEEETSLKINWRSQSTLLGAFSDPRRDKRRHTVSVAYIVTFPKGSQLIAGDDAKEVTRVHFDEIKKIDMFADHQVIVKDYLTMINKGNDTPEKIPEDGNPIIRSACQISRKNFKIES